MKPFNNFMKMRNYSTAIKPSENPRYASAYVENTGITDV